MIEEGGRVVIEEVRAGWLLELRTFGIDVHDSDNHNRNDRERSCIVVFVPLRWLSCWIECFSDASSLLLWSHDTFHRVLF